MSQHYNLNNHYHFFLENYFAGNDSLRSLSYDLQNCRIPFDFFHPFFTYLNLYLEKLLFPIIFEHFYILIYLKNQKPNHWLDLMDKNY